jgi:hypothetical protein
VAGKALLPLLEQVGDRAMALRWHDDWRRGWSSWAAAPAPTGARMPRVPRLPAVPARLLARPPRARRTIPLRGSPFTALMPPRWASDTPTSSRAFWSEGTFLGGHSWHGEQLPGPTSGEG